MGRRGDRRPKEVMNPGCPSDKRNLRNRLWQAGRDNDADHNGTSSQLPKDLGRVPAACNSPVLITEGLAGVRGKYGSKIEIRYNGPDLCV